MELSTPAEQRAFAVAKLKRAASLPRMKDGRRPPMHVEAVSEGERSQLDRQERDAPGQMDDDSPMMSEAQAEDEVEVTPPQPEPEPEPEPEVEAEHSEARADDPKTEEEPIISPPATPLLPEETPTKSRRRSRSRSRGRSSKDFKGKARATQSPVPTNAAHSANDSSPDEGPVLSAPQPTVFTSPPLISPIPAHFALLQHAQRFLASPEPGMMYPGTSPPTPMIPTLQEIQREALQRGLFRSNSAAARLMALQQLTSSDAFDPSFASPSATPPPLPGKIFRNNTVSGSGGERSAARKVMMRQLGKRLKEAEAEQTSGGEDPQPVTPTRRKRRSKRNSTNRPAVVDDREPPSAASPTTPVFPIPALLPSNFDLTRDIRSATPARTPTPNPRSPSVERSREDALAKLTGESPAAATYQYETALERRGVVVEEEDDAPEHDHGSASPISRLTYNGHLGSPPHPASIRSLHVSDAAPSALVESGDIGVSGYMPDSTQGQQDDYQSPFANPVDEKEGFGEDEEEEEEEERHVENEAARRSPWSDAYDREISWVAEPVPERIPVHDDNEYDDVEDTDEPEEHPSTPQPHSDAEEHEHEDDDESLPRVSTHSKDLLVDIETSPEPQTPSHMPPSPSSAILLHGHLSDDSSSRIFPTHVSASSPSQAELSSPNPEYLEWEDPPRVIATDTTPKKNGDNSQSKWDRVKIAFARSTSSNGRRSRTNSIRERTNNTDSSTSRESGASLTSNSKPDKEFASPYFPSSPGGVSPVPPASSETLLKYGGDAKLFPFPGMKRLEEERRARGGGLSLNASSPDIVSQPTLDEFSAISSGSASSRTPQPSPEISRDRKLSHQASDTRLLQKFSAGNSPSATLSPQSSATLLDAPSSPSGNSGWLNGKLPTNREGVKKWLSAKGLFPSQSSQPSYPSLQQQVPAPPAASQPAPSDMAMKPSLTELLSSQQQNDLLVEWEDASRTPTTTQEANAQGAEPPQDGHDSVAIETPSQEGSSTPETPARDKLPYELPHGRASNGDAHYAASPAHQLHSMSPAPDANSSATPDPTSSLDDYASQSSPSSPSSPERSPPIVSRTPSSMVLERLDEMLGRGSRGPSGGSLVDDPPRKLLLSSQVLQVANSNTVKDRFLFLFNDILVVAKPVTHDHDALLDTKPSPLDRKFIIKSVVQLRDVRFTADRDDLPLNSFASISRNPLIRTFVVQFAKDTDNAISHFFEKSQTRDDPVVLGQLLFRTLDLDRAKLGDYLSRRTSKVVLKAFIENFGFGGVRIDKALRVFLQSIHLAAPSRHANPLEYVSDSFASRWYDANADLIAYGKDLAIRLVRAIIQLNDVLYGGVVQDPWKSTQIKRNVTSRDFIDAFRRYDPRCFVSDELLDRIHGSVRREPLSQARSTAYSTTPDQIIVFKRPIPSRLTYRMQSEPVIVRIPQADPSLIIHLHGNELIFDPPYLTFNRSAEASFRITGSALGLKTVSFSRSGATALLYTGLPLSSPIVVERSFMRNTFQVAFVNHEHEKRRYMFSVDDPVMRHNWTVSLKRQIDVASSGQQAQAASSSQFYRAAEQIAFRVLQETLIPPTSGDWDNPRSAFSASTQLFPQARIQPLSPQRGSRVNGSLPATHVRSKSRSQVYHRQGPGKLEQEELDILLSPNGDTTDSPETEQEDTLPLEPGVRLWGGKELEMVCQQNSAIVLVLSSSQSEPANGRPSPSPSPLRPGIPVR
ncbi:hypothetical protein BC834DRAFT_866706 [Gloeopeniophorella convolvens]|nr:hypothetical protein BC834DRAFT_866706 [Gloeopeniophorella convolvens]